MGYRISPLTAAMAVAFSSTAIWQTAIAETAPVLTEVVVSASKSQPLAGAATLDSSQLAPLRAATSDTASLLRDVPGVSLYGAGGVSSLPSIHGLADDRLRVTVDGMDLIASCPNHMNPALSYIDPTNVGSLKVYSGIAPVSLGGDSIGGTILAQSLAPKFAAPGQELLATGEIGAFYRSNGDAMGGNVSATMATENFSVNYTGAYAQSDNYKAAGDFKTTTATGRIGHTLPLDEVGSTAYKTINQKLGFAFKGGDHLVEGSFGFQNVPEQLYPNQRMDMLDNDQQTFNLRYLGQFGWGLFEARAYHEKVDHFMDFGPDKRFWYGTQSGGPLAANGTPCSPISATCAAGMPMYSKSTNTGVTAKADIDLGAKDLLRVGGLYQAYKLDDWWPPSGGGMWPGTFDNINDGTRDRLGLFGEWESRLNAQWLTLLGARYERVATDAGDVRGYNTAPTAMGNQYVDANTFNAQDRQRTDNNWDLTALARYTPNVNGDIEFGFARKVRSPNLYQRYTWSTWSMAAVMNNMVGDGNGYIGNIDLKPETAYTVAATFDWHAADRSWEIKATPYFTRVNDYIDAIRCTAGASCTAVNRTTTNQFVVLQYANQEAELYGLDLSGRMPLAKSGIGEFGFTGLLNYTHGENRDTGDGLYNIMPLNGKLALTHQTGGWDNAVELVLVQGKDDVSDVRNEITTAGYGLTNLRASYSWKQARIDFGIENLFDKFYYMPLGGAYTGQGTTMSLNGIPWGIAVPGMGRSLYAGVNFKF
jgi:iron complex outermembrane recepter protein